MGNEHSGKPNRLINETSPYLRQHAHNAVDWRAWNAETLAFARAEDKPIFLSIGYSTCHWCHVMEAESFENIHIANILNADFVPVKVDREERPDLDELYMNATQMMTGRGGWPNSVWLTPDGWPWFAGTYFPPETFAKLLGQLAEAWRSRRADVEAQANQLAEVLRKVATPVTTAEAGGGEDPLHAALAYLARSYDKEFGGFGDAPKFPPHGALALLAHVARPDGPQAPLEMMIATLTAMAHGGVHDHIGGGFHRYSTDERWFLPHFEKMLYDNALLLRAYAEGFRLTGNAECRAIALAIAKWVSREMTSPGGGFYSALDADVEGKEGGCYVWTRSEVLEILGAGDGGFFSRVYGIEETGNYHDEALGRMTGKNIPYLRGPLDKLLKAEGVEPTEGRKRLALLRLKLLDARNRRPQPSRDEKILSGWNGLMIGALAQAGKLLNQDELLAAAECAADFVLAKLRPQGRLLHGYAEGKAALPAYLDDCAYLANGLLDLFEATNETRWKDAAVGLAEEILEHYADDAAGGFFLTPDDGESLLTRWKPGYDQPLPSGNGVAAQIFVRLCSMTGDGKWLEEAKRILAAFDGLMRAAPHGTMALILARVMFNEAAGENARVEREPIRMTLDPAEIVAKQGDIEGLRLQITVAAGYHIAAEAAFKVEIAPNAVARLKSLRLPKPTKKAIGDTEMDVLEGEFAASVELQMAEDAAEGAHTLSMEITVQPCTDRECLPPIKLRKAMSLLIARKS